MKSTRNTEPNKEQTFAGCGKEISRRKFMASSLLEATAMLGTGSLLKASDNLMTTNENELRLAKNYKCKITVIRRELYEDLRDEYCADPNTGKCNAVEDGQEWIVDGPGFMNMLNGQFCSIAWDCISKYVYSALNGGSLLRGWMKDDKVMIACCNDGIRPVIFRLERIDEDE